MTGHWPEPRQGRKGDLGDTALLLMRPNLCCWWKPRPSSPTSPHIHWALMLFTSQANSESPQPHSCSAVMSLQKREAPSGWRCVLFIHHSINKPSLNLCCTKGPVGDNRYYRPGPCCPEAYSQRHLASLCWESKTK